MPDQDHGRTTRLPNLAAAPIQATRDGRDGKAAAAARASAAGAPG